MAGLQAGNTVCPCRAVQAKHRGRRARRNLLHGPMTPPGPNPIGWHGHCLGDAPRVTTPPWKLEAWGTTHVSSEIVTALPDSTVIPPTETVTRAGPLIVTNRFRR